MSRYARRTDDNQTEIVKALEARGHKVQSLASVGGGCIDLLVGVGEQSLRSIRPKGEPRVFVGLEVKDGRQPPSRRRLTPAEVRWHQEWSPWPVKVVYCAEDALEFVEGRNAQD